MSEFDLKKYLAEHKLTVPSQLLNEEESDKIKDTTARKDWKWKSAKKGSKSVNVLDAYKSFSKQQEKTKNIKEGGDDILEEEVYRSFADAKQEAIRISMEDGVVQHVNKAGGGAYKVSDWYDGDNTVYSVEDGRELNEEEDPNMTDVPSHGFDPAGDPTFNRFVELVAKEIFTAGLDDPTMHDIIDWDSLFEAWDDFGNLHLHSQQDIIELMQEAGVTPQDQEYILDLPQVRALEKG